MKLARLLLAALLAFAPPSARAASWYIAPAPVGNDANDCSFAAQCLTLKRVCDAISAPGFGGNTIYLADSPTAYAGGCAILYYNIATVIGDCANPGNTWIDPGPPYGFGFWLQDHALVGINCVMLHNDSTLGVGIQSRQFVIFDFANVYFGAMQVDVLAMEKSKGNCLSASIYGNATNFASASDQSSIFLNCHIALNAGTFAAFTAATKQSEINDDLLVVTGTQSGSKCARDDTSLITNVANLPGAGSC